MANQDDGTVTGIDAISGETKTFRFGHPLQVTAAGQGKLLTILLPGKTYEDRIDELEGDVGRFFIQPYLLLDLDPAIARTTLPSKSRQPRAQRLVTHPGEEAPAGWELQPEVAAQMPRISNGGRTYTFEIRNDYAFSPPSNEPITAETFKYSIERALSPRMGSPSARPPIHR